MNWVPMLFRLSRPGQMDGVTDIVNLPLVTHARFRRLHAAYALITATWPGCMAPTTSSRLALTPAQDQNP